MSKSNRKRKAAKNLSSQFQDAAYSRLDPEVETRNEQLHRYFNSLSPSIVNSTQSVSQNSQKRRRVAPMNDLLNHEIVEVFEPGRPKTRSLENKTPLSTAPSFLQKSIHTPLTTKRKRKEKHHISGSSLSKKSKRLSKQSQEQSFDKELFNFPGKGDTDEDIIKDANINLKSVSPLTANSSRFSVNASSLKKVPSSLVKKRTERMGKRKTANITNPREDVEPEQYLNISTIQPVTEGHFITTSSPNNHTQSTLSKNLTAETNRSVSKTIGQHNTSMTTHSLSRTNSISADVETLPKTVRPTSSGVAFEKTNQSSSSVHQRKDVEKSPIGSDCTFMGSHNLEHSRVIRQQLSLLREPIMFGGILKHKFEAAQANSDLAGEPSKINETVIQRGFKRYNKKLLHYFHKHAQDSEYLQRKAIKILNNLSQPIKNIYFEKFWSQAERDLNFSYPKEFPSCHCPSKSQYNEYAQIAKRIERLQEERKNKESLLSSMTQIVYTMDELKKADDKFLMSGSRINIGSKLLHGKKLSTALVDARSIMSVLESTNPKTQK